MNKALRDEVMQLTPAERVELAMDLWDSVLPEAESLPALTPEQMDEIDRRIAEYEKDPSKAIPYEDVRQWLWSRRK